MYTLIRSDLKRFALLAGTSIYIFRCNNSEKIIEYPLIFGYLAEDWSRILVAILYYYTRRTKVDYCRYASSVQVTDKRNLV